MNTTHTELPRPWYREPAPWLLALGPAVVVVAACFTAWLAVSRPDTVIAEDYYKRGLHPGRDELATRIRSAALTAELAMDAHTRKLRLVAYGEAGKADEATLALHAVQGSGSVRVFALKAAAPGEFESDSVTLPSGQWEVTARIGGQTLIARWKIPGPTSVALSTEEGSAR